MKTSYVLPQGRRERARRGQEKNWVLGHKGDKRKERLRKRERKQELAQLLLVLLSPRVTCSDLKLTLTQNGPHWSRMAIEKKRGIIFKFLVVWIGLEKTLLVSSMTSVSLLARSQTLDVSISSLCSRRCLESRRRNTNWSLEFLFLSLPLKRNVWSTFVAK